MADLAACYFCGAALDDALQTVRLGNGPSLTLCRSCREKLQRVLDAVDGGSVGDASEPTTVDRGTDISRGSDDPHESLDHDSADPEPSDSDDEIPGQEPSGDPSQSATTDEERAVVAGDQDVSALEYNKVMRMLKNRDFPVDRDEFVAVAANAYQVSYTDCDRVIDAAIDQGLLDEEDGRLVRPD